MDPITNPYVPYPVRIDAVTIENDEHDLKTFKLVFLDPEHEKAFEYTPGQFAELSVLGKGECPIGIASSPTEEGYLLFTVKKTGVVSGELHSLAEGKLIGVRGPLGKPYPIDRMKGKNVVIVGGGFAFTTLRALTQYMIADGNRSEFGEITVIYGARSPGELLYKEELKAWEARDDLKTIITVDKGDDAWKGREGFVPTVLEEVAPSSKDALMAVFAKQKPDGFIPHMMVPTEEGDSEITQPPVLAWAVWETFEKSGDIEFLRAALPHLLGYLEWDVANRRPSDDTWLFAWRDGNESGMDNSPRFDAGQPFYAVDFSAFMAHECEHVAHIADALGDGELAAHWRGVRAKIAHDINAVLWQEDAGLYFGAGLDRASLGIKTEAAFAPLLAGVADEAQAGRMAQHLGAAEEFARPFPVPSTAADEPTYGDDMWRGPVWINYNYMIVRGLERSGQHGLAQEIKQKTLHEIVRWYHELGSIFEFYDAEGTVPPPKLDRKGYKHDHRRMACIADYNWSAACFVDLVMASASR